MNDSLGMRRSPPNWQNTILPANSTIKDAIISLDESSLQIVMVVDDNKRLLGTITDGDIRRGLLRKHLIEDPVEVIFQKEPLVASLSLGFDAVKDLMEINRVRQLPIIDDFRRVVGLYVDGNIGEDIALPNTMVIMCGGKGTRMLPRTKNLPKPMLPINGRPILERIIIRAKQEGFRNFVLATHHLGDIIEEHFGRGDALGVKIDYLKEPEPLGTAGGLSFYRESPRCPIVVINGDVLADIRYRDLLNFHDQYFSMATMAVRYHEWKHPFGVVRVNGFEITGFEEKPVNKTYINAGIYVLDPSCLGHLKENEYCDMPDLFSTIRLSGGRTIAYPIHELWRDIGSPEDYELANGKTE
jgi:dTDP-glucose pyrophosphorylase